MKRGAVVVGLLASAGLALALRLPRLAERPMHTDEAVHAVKFAELWKAGQYQYDPNDYHGPTLYYFTFPMVWLGGARDFATTTETTYRLVPVLFGIGLVLLLGLVADGLGRVAVASAGVLTAVSPALAYYSRYYIQETLLVFFTFVALAAGWRYVQSRRLGWALLVGVGVGLMHATKETCVLVWGAAALAGVLTWVWNRPRPSPGRKPAVWPALALAALAAIITSFACFSNFFTNLRGPVDSILALAGYVTRAGAGMHTHPWDYYLRTLLWTHYPPAPVFTEALIVVLALVGAGGAILARGIAAPHLPLARFLTLYTVILTSVYSAIPYKTPWCALGFLHALILLAGVGVAVLFASLRPPVLRVALAVLLLAGTAQLGQQAWRAVTTYAADNRNPYVYTHPLRDVVELGAWAEKLAAAHADGSEMLIKIVAPHAWPLPWYLRRLQHVGYWETPPADVDAPLVIATQELLPTVAARWHQRYHLSYYGLRPSETLVACVDDDLWQAFVERENRRTPPDSSKR
jgi:uncharacterized protein (TIGR03663 family)